MSKLGGRYLDGAIMTPIDTIGTPDASILFAGARELYDAHRAVFEVLGTATWLGESAILAAGYDMALLDMFWSATAGYLHALELAQHAGIEPTDFLPHALGIVEILPAIFTDTASRVEDGRHDNATSSVPPSRPGWTPPHWRRSAGTWTGWLPPVTGCERPQR